MESKNTHRRNIYISDLDCAIIPVELDLNGNITDERIWSILTRSMYRFTDFKSTPLLIALVKGIILKFYAGDDSPFIIEKLPEGIKYYRFSNDANLSLSFTPIKDKEGFLLIFSSGVEMEC